MTMYQQTQPELNRCVVTHRKMRGVNIQCWLRETDVLAAKAGMAGVQETILLVIANMLPMYNPNRSTLKWDDVSIRILPTQMPVPFD